MLTSDLWYFLSDKETKNPLFRDYNLNWFWKLDYTKYDHSACQWNQFLKDFCSDEFSDYYSNKLKVAAIIWKKVRDSKNEKIYSRQLLNEYGYKIEEYHK